MPIIVCGVANILGLKKTAKNNNNHKYMESKAKKKSEWKRRKHKFADDSDFWPFSHYNFIMQMLPLFKSELSFQLKSWICIYIR